MTATTETAKVVDSHEVEAVSKARRSIVLVILGIFLTIGTTIFFYTTTISRAELPIDQVHQFGEELKLTVEFVIPVYLNVPEPLKEKFLNVETPINQELSRRYPNLHQFWSIELRHGTSNPIIDYVVNFQITDEDESTVISSTTKEINLKVTSKTIQENSIVDLMIHALLDELFLEELESFSKIVDNQLQDSNIILPYSSNYNVVLSLFTESGNNIEWEIEDSMKSFDSIFKQLKHFSNFSISSQIQYYSNLADDLFYEQDGKSIIKEADLSTFINFGDWNLFTHDINPTINLIIYFPKYNYNNIPSVIENSQTNSFLVPQWGGVYIMNKNAAKQTDIILKKSELLPILDIFASQLFQLIGMPHKPKSVLMRIDHLSRTSLFKNLRQALDNLNSLIKLTESLNEISIPENTKNHVESSLKYINSTIISIKDQDFFKAMELSAHALQDSNLAFFEKEMVQQAYFPSEHKLAVFLPLLGPVCTVCFLGLIKYLRERKQIKQKSD